MVKGLEIRHEGPRKRFVADVEDKEAYLSYREADERLLDYAHTYVPPEHREKGIGEAIVLRALEHARETGVSIIPSCPFVSHVLEENPEYREIVAEGERKALPGGEG